MNNPSVKYLPAAVVAENDVEQENEEDFGRVSNKSSLPLRDETSLKFLTWAIAQYFSHVCNYKRYCF